ncbi:hypothetical protein AHiyo8_10880 [Arthrobacter sp. Hiyo8]|nr:hypothetical protein AHiyo8_10880 [Arthrobacter sp. Hiyo8]
MLSRLSLAPKHDDKEDDSLHLHDGVSTDTREITVIPGPLRPVTMLRGRNDHDGQTGQDEARTPGAASPRAGLDELLGGAPGGIAKSRSPPVPGRRMKKLPTRERPSASRHGQALQHSELG